MIIDSGKFNVIAGPCSVENEEQIIEIAKSIKESGASFLRGGAFKMRTSPYSFQGLGLEGLKYLKIAKKVAKIPIVSEITDLRYIDEYEDVDIIQVGTRNMQNYEMLKELGKTKKTILLKRGFANTIEEWLMSVEYIMRGGNEKIILCERGIRTFETQTRNTLDISAIPIIKRKCKLPIIIDPSHAAGAKYLVEPLSKAAIAIGADGLMIEVHNNPKEALSDGEQSLDLKEFKKMMDKLKILIEFNNKNKGDKRWKMKY